MIVELNGFICHGNIGAKARSLVDLHRNEFKVPTSIAIDTKEFFDAIKNIKGKINLLLDRINFDNIEVISKQIKMLFDNVSIDDTTIEELKRFIRDDEEYILRCSIDGVDEQYSYAGLFPVRKGIKKSNIVSNIIECYKSIYSYNSLYYMVKNEIDYSDIGCAVIVQRSIQTDLFGYATTLNPITLNSTEINLRVSSNGNSEGYCYDFINDEFISEDEYKILSKSRVLETIDLLKNIQVSLGYPVDIELAYTKNSIYVLQARGIQNILYENMESIWKKKSISSKKFMYSLVAENYQKIIDEYYDDLKIKTNEKAVSLEINGCYYNVVNISNIVDQILDYDDSYFVRNINIDYKIERINNLKKKFKRFKNRKYIDNKINALLETIIDFKDNYKTKYSEYCRLMTKVNAKDIERTWASLVFEDYNTLYQKYLDLKLLVLIQKNKLYKSLMPYLSINEFNEVIFVKEATNKYKVDKEYNELIKKIKNDEDAYRYWFSSSTLKILKNYNEGYDNYYHKEFKHFIDTYGYLSYFKFDLSESFYVEDVEDVIRDLKKQLANFEIVEDNEMDREAVILKLQNDMMDKTYSKAFDSIKKLQDLIIEFFDLKDYILKFNFIVKRYTKMLAKLYLKREILDNESDIWYLDINTIYDYIEGEIDPASAKGVMLKNKQYFNSYRNFQSTTNIGYMHEKINDATYKGIGLSTDIVKGRVRMIKSLKDLETLTSNDILVTKTLNNNLLFQLPVVRGIIISDMNVSNSVKNILREFRIPCIILDNCSKKLNDGELVKFDAKTGDIKRIKK